MTISGIMNIALSGMNAQTNRLSAVANNIANVDTPGYRRATTGLTALSSGGVEANVTQPASDSNASPDEGSNVDMATELTDMTDAETSFKANAAAFETGASMWDALLAIKRD